MARDPDAPEEPNQPDRTLATADDLDIDAQIDDLAAALQFELDDDEDDDGSPLMGDEDLALDDDPPTVAEPVSAPPESLSSDDDLALHEDPETYVGLEPDPESIDVLDGEEFEELDADEIDEVAEVADEASGAIVTEPSGAAVRARPLYLEVEGRVAKVDQDRFVIGRVSKMCDFPIIDVNISRQHCAIERRGGAYYVIDLGSTNGVQLDGRRVDNHEIAEGDVLVLSGHEMRASFFAPLPEARPAPMPHPAAEEAVAPHVTGRLEPVPVARAQPIAQSQPGPKSQPIAQSQPGPQMTAMPQMMAAQSTLPEPTRAPDPSLAVPIAAGGFEQRMEQRLDQLSQQVAYLQQAVQVLLARTEALQGLGPLAHMIQTRLGQKSGG